jgi:hypothetical protein
VNPALAPRIFTPGFKGPSQPAWLNLSPVTWDHPVDFGLVVRCEEMPRPGCLPSSQVRGTTLRSHTPLPAYRHPNPLTPPCPAPAFGSGSTPGALPHEADIPRCLLPTPYTGPLLTTSRILQAAKHRTGGGYAEASLTLPAKCLFIAASSTPDWSPSLRHGFTVRDLTVS